MFKYGAGPSSTLQRLEALSLVEFLLLVFSGTDRFSTIRDLAVTGLSAEILSFSRDDTASILFVGFTLVCVLSLNRVCCSEVTSAELPACCCVDISSTSFGCDLDCIRGEDPKLGFAFGKRRLLGVVLVSELFSPLGRKSSVGLREEVDSNGGIKTEAALVV